MSTIPIHKSEQPIIDTAINLGDWLLSFPEVSERMAKQIKLLQAKLREVPNIRGDIDNWSYSYTIEKGPDTEGLVRSWIVSLSNFTHDKARSEGLGIWSTYTRLPQSNIFKDNTFDQKQFLDMVGHEEWLSWYIGDNSHKPYANVKWVDEVNDPLQFFEKGNRLLIEVEYGNHSLDCYVQL